VSQKSKLANCSRLFAFSSIRGPSANNYTFTKALGEGLVTEQMDNLPVIIQRPSAGEFG
jgi:hypothetical protein